MPEVTAELAYLFRHAMLREAAYQLYTPGERASLHRAVVEIGMEIWGREEGRLKSVAEDLANHAGISLAERQDAQLARTELQLLKLGAEYARNEYRNEDALAMLRRLSESPAADAAQRARALLDVGRVCFALGRPAEVVDAAGRARELAGDDAAVAAEACVMGAGARMKTGDLAGASELIELSDINGITNVAVQVEAWLTRHEIHVARGEMDAALQALEVGRAAAEAGGNELGMSRIRGRLGGFYIITGRPKDARRELEAALEIAERNQSLVHTSALRTNLALIERQGGNFELAEASFRQACEDFRKTGQVDYHIQVMNLLANLLSDTGRISEAREAFEAAMDLCREGGAFRQLAFLRGNYASVLVRTGKVEDGLTEYRRAIADARKFGNADAESTHLVNLSAALHNLARLDEAEAVGMEALECCRRIRNRRFEGLLLRNLADLFLLTGRLGRAQTVLGQAFEVLRDVNELMMITMAHKSRAEIMLLMGEPLDRVRAYAAAATPGGLSPMQRFPIEDVVGFHMYATDPGATADGIAGAMDRLRDRAREASSESNEFESELSKCRKVAEEFQRAQREQRDPRVLGGFFVPGFEASTRAALVAHYKKNRPEQWADIQNRPALLEALCEGIDQIPEPDWQDTTPL